MRSQKENVLIVHNYYQIPGGEDTVVACEKKLLEDNGHQVTMYTRNNSELNDMSALRKLVLPITTIFNPRTFKDIKRIIKENKIDIVHVHNTLNLISSAVYYAARSCQVPVVQTIHNFRLLCPGATFYRDDHICEECVDKGLRCALRYSCYRGSRIQTLAAVMNTWIHRKLGIYKYLKYICLTDFNREKLLSLSQLSDTQVFIKPNFVEAYSDSTNHQNRLDQYVFAGRLDRLKGIDILLKAWKAFGPDAPKLIVCGTGPMEDWCKEYIDTKNLQWVELKGFVQNADAKRMIKESKALILPTQWYEGFPMSIAEAFAMGTPVITSDIGNAGSIVTEGLTGAKFEHTSADALIEAVKRLETYDDIYATTRQAYETHYTRDSNYQTLVEIYRSV